LSAANYNVHGEALSMSAAITNNKTKSTSLCVNITVTFRQSNYICLMNNRCRHACQKEVRHYSST
jgi:hypothetical protein